MTPPPAGIGLIGELLKIPLTVPLNVASVYCKNKILVKEGYRQYLYKLCYSRKKTKYIVFEKYELRRRRVIKQFQHSQPFAHRSRLIFECCINFHDWVDS